MKCSDCYFYEMCKPSHNCPYFFPVKDDDLYEDEMIRRQQVKEKKQFVRAWRKYIAEENNFF